MQPNGDRVRRVAVRKDVRAASDFRSGVGASVTAASPALSSLFRLSASNDVAVL